MLSAVLTDTGLVQRSKNKKNPLLYTVVELDAEQALLTESLLMCKGRNQGSSPALKRV